MRVQHINRISSIVLIILSLTALVVVLLARGLAAPRIASQPGVDG